MKSKWDITRRDLLKSLGVGAACLPILRSSPVWADAAASKRFLLIANSEGYIVPAWRPPVGPLASATFPASTKSLEPFRNELSFVTNLDQPNYPVGYNWAHECYGVIYWGGPSSPPSGKYHEPHGATLDQVVAKAVPLQAGERLTLNLMAQVDNKPASGTPGAFRCFWTGRGAPINPQGNPATVYGQLFAGRPAPAPTTGGAEQPTGPDPATVKLLGTQKSILDYVGKSLERFKTRVGREERGSIDGHFAAIRTLETEISGLGGPPRGGIGGPGFQAPKPEMFDNAAISSQPGLFPKIMNAQLDIALMALTSGVTRVATVQLSNSAGNYFNFGLFVPGVPARNSTGYKSQFVNFHDAAHNPQQGGIKVKELIDKWFMDQFAGFLTKAKAVQEPGGTFLDNNLVMWGNHMGDGGAHSAYQINWLFAGKAGGAARAGVHIDGGSPLRGGGGGKSTSNAMADICKIMGVREAPAHFTGTVGLAT